MRKLEERMVVYGDKEGAMDCNRSHLRQTCRHTDIDRITSTLSDQCVFDLLTQMHRFAQGD